METCNHRLLTFCAYVHRLQPELRLTERVIPFDVAETTHIIGFNPVARNARILTYQVVALMEAIRKCWSQTTFVETPRLARWLFNTNYALIEGGATFVQAYDLVSPGPNRVRSAIVRKIRNARIRAEWEWLADLKDVQREERVESTFNRVKPFVEHQLIRNIIGQQTNTVDFPAMLANRKIFLVNLARQGSIAQDDQHLLGTLLVNEILTAAFARAPGSRVPYYLFIDEFQHFVTKDMCEILDGGRKFGLHLILAHQHLSQLKERDPEVYYSALTNARLKTVFGGMDDDDLDVLAKELYTGEFDPDQVKDEIWQTKFRPVESTRVVTSSTSGNSSGSAFVSHQSLMSGTSYIPGSDFFSPGLTTRSESSTFGSSRQSTESLLGQRNQVRSPVLRIPRVSGTELADVPLARGTAVPQEGATETAINALRRRPYPRQQGPTHSDAAPQGCRSRGRCQSAPGIQAGLLRGRRLFQEPRRCSPRSRRS